MSSRTFICWDCRMSYRSDIHVETTVRRCAKCGANIDFVSEKVEVPAKSDVRAWEALRQDLAVRSRSQHDAAVRSRVRRQHEIEQTIRDLEGRPENPGRTRQIALLHKELDRLNDPL